MSTLKGDDMSEKLEGSKTYEVPVHGGFVRSFRFYDMRASCTTSET
jgi:hypothetical protein